MIRLLHALNLPTVTSTVNGTDCVEVDLHIPETEEEG